MGDSVPPLRRQNPDLDLVDDLGRQGLAGALDLLLPSARLMPGSC